MINIQLTEEEIAIAIKGGNDRNDAVDKFGIVSQRCVGSSKANHELGACGEYAAAKYFRENWDPSVFKTREQAYSGNPRVDVGKRFEIRTTKYHTGRLPVQPRDKDERAFVLVISRGNGLFSIMGWLPGVKVKEIGSWEDHGYPCWYAYQRDLYPLASLEEILNRETNPNFLPLTHPKRIGIA
jgi:hypothetical protein